MGSYRSLTTLFRKNWVVPPKKKDKIVTQMRDFIQHKTLILEIKLVKL